MLANGNSLSSSSAGRTCSSGQPEGQPCAEAAIWSHWMAGSQDRQD